MKSSTPRSGGKKTLIEAFPLPSPPRTHLEPPPPPPWRRVQFDEEKKEEVEEAIDALRGYSALSRDETTEDALNRSHLNMQNEPDVDGEISVRVGNNALRDRVRPSIQIQLGQRPSDRPSFGGNNDIAQEGSIEESSYSSETEGSRSTSSERSLYSPARSYGTHIPGLATPRGPTDIKSLMDELSALREENARLKQGDSDLQETTQIKRLPYTSHVFHQVGDALYLDEPHYEHRAGGGVVLCANVPIRSDDYYLLQHPEIAFAIYKKYNKPSSENLSKIETIDGVFRTPAPTSEYISLTASEMQDAVEELIEQVPFFHQHFPDFDFRRKLRSPYMFMFYSAPFLSDILPRLDVTSQNLLRQLKEAIDQSYGHEYELARSQAKKGMVSRHHLRYLIRPGDVLIEGSYSESSQAWISTSWLEMSEEIDKEKQTEEWRSARRKRTQRQSAMSETAGHKAVTTYGWSLNAWAWRYDGVFEKQYKTLRMYMWNTRKDEAVKITSLSVYPLRFAPPQVRASFEQRGRMFWSLRYWRFISYLRKEDDELLNIEDRYVVDTKTYKRLFPKSKIARMQLKSSISTSEMMSDQPPEGDALLVFPPSIMAYNLPSKVWRQLYVDRITDIAWNKQAFKDLVAEDETKELVQALVTKQLNSNVSTDFVTGKGNGLIMLLHGAPGTGKTFTAEGVAEFAEKPLLRVTCGDVGTEAEVVDQRLQGIFELGRIWDCVVLLDEADVFLEDRDMKDLNRNALVSVFLRALEYYDGILILTSNRVGTFDEAFKSRIQLSLHYENLGPTQRRKIWRNFMNRIKKLEAEEGGTETDVEDILDHIDELSKEPMNGREIRNAITIARQLAQFKEERFRYSHLQHVIKVGGKFGKYLEDLREGFTDDDIKRDNHLRLSYALDGK